MTKTRVKVNREVLIEKIEKSIEKKKKDYEKALAKYEIEYPKYLEKVADLLTKIVEDIRGGNGECVSNGYQNSGHVSIKKMPPLPAKPSENWNKDESDLRLLKVASDETITVTSDSNWFSYL